MNVGFKIYIGVRSRGNVGTSLTDQRILWDTHVFSKEEVLTNIPVSPYKIHYRPDVFR